MDDANLKFLSITDQPSLSPAFNKDIVAYKLVVASTVQNLKFNLSPSDNGASFSIKSNTTGWADNNELKLTEGDNQITIEVTSEDGTTKKYSITCTKLSASVAALKTMSLNGLDLVPCFTTDCYDYEAYAPFDKLTSDVDCQTFDPDCNVEVICNLSKPLLDWHSFGLNYGFSELCLKVTSPDKTTTVIYRVIIFKRILPRLALFAATNTNVPSKRCPISLAPAYCSVEINQTAYSLLFIDMFQRISSDDPLNQISISADDGGVRSDLFRHTFKENEVSSSQIKIPLINGSYSSETSLREISNLLSTIEEADNLISKDEAAEYVSPEEIKSIESLPEVKMTSWEKQLQNIYYEQNFEVLADMSRSWLEKYFDLINNIDIKKIRNLDTITDEVSEESPLYALNMSLYSMATAIKHKTRDYQSHIKLALLLEEKYLFENIYGRKLKEEQIDTLDLQNKNAHESSKEEDIAAICVLRNYGLNPSNYDILKALDEEYHYCLETGQNHKADQVQGLYLFKSKKISDNMKEAHNQNSINFSDREQLRRQSNHKLLDAMSIMLEMKLTNRFSLDLQIGRSFCQSGDYLGALTYLRNTLNWSDSYFKTLARFYYGFAAAKQMGFVNDLNVEVVVNYIGNGLIMFIRRLMNKFGDKKNLFFEDHLNIFNTLFLEGFLLIGNLRTDFKIKSALISAEDSLRYASWLACVALSEFDSRTKIEKVYQESQLFKDLHRILLDAHTRLIILRSIDLVNSSNEVCEITRSEQARSCVNLLNLIRSSCNKSSEEVLRLQEKIGQMLVYSDPLDGYYLLLLACAKFELTEFLLENKKQIYSKELFDEMLAESESLLLTSLALQKDIGLLDVSTKVTGQKWWVKLHKSLLELKKKRELEVAKAVGKKSETSAVASRGKPVVTPKVKAAPAAKTTAKKSTQKTSTSSIADIEEPVKEPAKEPLKESVDQEIPIFKSYTRNKSATYNLFIVFYQTQLYLARVYSRQGECDKARSCYEAVIEKEPKRQEAYVELATMLKQNGNVSEAINVYASFPVTEIGDSKKETENKRVNSATNPPIKLLQRKKKEHSLFNDAFIYGELVVLLMGEKSYDDPRLAKYLTLWAKIMGPGIIEKEILCLNKANKTKVCKQIFAGIHNKPLDDPDLVQFFSFKGW